MFWPYFPHIKNYEYKYMTFSKGFSPEIYAPFYKKKKIKRLGDTLTEKIKLCMRYGEISQGFDKRKRNHIKMES